MVDPTLNTVGERPDVFKHSPLAPFMIALVRALGALPFGMRSRAGYALGYLVGLLPIREREIASKQLQLFFGKERAQFLTPRVFAHVCRSLFESLSLGPAVRRGDNFIRCDRWTDIDTWLKQPRPVMGLTGHVGNWDLLAAAMIGRGARVSTVAKEARSPAVQAALRSLREGYGIETIWRSDRSGVKRLMQCLRENRVVAALIDQDTRVSSVYVPFFGLPARTPDAIIALGKKSNARFVSAFLVRESDGGFRLHVREISDELSVGEILFQYNSHLEEIVRLHPEQWVWFHKRWRSQPGQETMSTRAYLLWLDEQLNRPTVASSSEMR